MNYGFEPESFDTTSDDYLRESISLDDQFEGNKLENVSNEDLDLLESNNFTENERNCIKIRVKENLIFLFIIYFYSI